VANVNEAPAVTSFTVPAGGILGSPLDLSAAAADPDGAADPLTYTWTITRPGGGTATLTGAAVRFTPAEFGSYAVTLTARGAAGATAPSQATILVDKATPVVTWSDPGAIVYGTPLSDAQVNATADVPGTFTYDVAADSVLGAGSHTLEVTFTPDDTDHYHGLT